MQKSLRAHLNTLFLFSQSLQLAIAETGISHGVAYKNTPPASSGIPFNGYFPRVNLYGQGPIAHWASGFGWKHYHYVHFFKKLEV